MVNGIAKFAFLLMFISVTLNASDVNISISSKYNTVGIEEQFNVSIKISGNTARLPSINISRFKGFDVVSTSTSQNFNFINGKISVEKDYTYTLMSRSPGSYTIGPFSVKYKGKQIQSNVLKITVKKGVKHKKKRSQPAQTAPQFNFDFGAPGGSRQSANNGFTVQFVSEVNKRKVLEGEETILTYRIIRDISFATNPNISFPDFKGFWKEDLDQKNPYYITKNGKRYLVNEISFALFPTKTGKIIIPSAKFSGYVNTFFTDPFSGGNKKILRNTKPIIIDVRPINKDTLGFSGGVGEFKISDSLVADNVNEGEPVIRKITISGNGNLPLIQKPATSYPHSFRVFSSKIEQNIDRKTGISGSITFKEMIIPEEKGKYIVPGVKFKYYDTRLKRMKVLSTDSLRLKVNMGETVKHGTGTIESDNHLRLSEKAIFKNGENRFLLYFYMFVLLIFIFVLLLKLLSVFGIKISLLEKGRVRFTLSKIIGQIRKFESLGEYKKALRLIKRYYISAGRTDDGFIKECDKLLFKPVELTKEEYEAFKKKFSIS